MTMLNHTTRYPPALVSIRRGADGLLARTGRLINRLVAAVIARHHRQAELSALRQMSDRQLKDMGLYRCQIGAALDEAAATRERLQGFDRH
jgi:uncharacterized protein YjiS (DUF1127 family)